MIVNLNKKVVIFSLVGLAIAFSSSDLIASHGSSTKDKPFHLNDYFAKEEIINKSLITYLTFEDKQRLANYEKQYLDEYKRIMQRERPLKVFHVQPVNKMEACKIWILTSREYSNDLMTGFKHYWDGACKNGYADGIGREFLKADKHDAWVLANYENGVPIYYIEKNRIATHTLRACLTFIN